MDKITELLATPLNNDNGHDLRSQLATAESQLYYAALQCRKAEEELADYRGKFYNPGLKTELERKVDMERNTRAFQKCADEWADAVKALQTRISLGQTFLKTMEAEIKGGIR